MSSQASDLLQAASKVEIPEWATHIAARKDGSKAEPAAWLEREKDYVDEDPSKLKAGQWAGSYKQKYWEFIPIERVKPKH